MKHNWEYKKLGEVCDIYQPKTISTTMLVENGKYPVYGANGIIGKYDKYNHQEKELLMTCRGATCGSINVSQPYSWINGNAMVIHPLHDNIVFDFLKYQLMTLNLSCIVTGAAQPQITRQSLTPILIPLPPLPVQERIVEELDRLSLILEKKKQQIKELDSLAQSIFYDMFGDPIENEKGWEVKKLGEICSDKQHIIRANKYFSKTAKIQYIDISSINNSSNTITNTTTFVFENAPSRAQQKVEYGDVLISLVRPNLKNIASIDIMCNNLVASSGFCVLRGINVSQYYIKALVLTNHFTKYLTERVSGANYPAIHEEDIKNCIIGIPPLDLQQSFAKKIEVIEKQKELINQSIKEVQLLFDAKMDYYFGD